MSFFHSNNTATVNASLTTTLLTIGLAIILCVIIAGYVWVGMRQAANNEVLVTLPNTDQSTTTPAITPEQRMTILQGLSQSATTTVSTADKQAILEALSSQSTTTVSDEQRVHILDSLSKTN